MTTLRALLLRARAEFGLSRLAVEAAIVPAAVVVWVLLMVVV